MLLTRALIDVLIRSSLMFVLFYMSLSAYSAQAEEMFSDKELEIDQLMSLSLDELLAVNVIVASKRLQSAADAPGIVTSYTRADIGRLGYYTLADLANITPGYSTYSIYGEKVFETRGEKAASFENNKHLVMIDGIPVNHGRANKAHTEEELPLFFAERVEFLRGPGSPLYGVSAFYGVINIVSTDLDENGSLVENKVTFGNQDGDKRVMSNMIHRTDEGQFKVNAGYYKKSASKDYVGTENTERQLYWDDQESIFFNVQQRVDSGVLRGFSAGMILLYTDGGLGEFWGGVGGSSHELNALIWRTWVPYVKYETMFGEDWAYNGYVKFNESEEKGVTARGAFGESGIGTYEEITESWELFSELRWRMNEDSDILFGINWNTSKRTDESFVFGADLDAAPPQFTENPTNHIESDGFDTLSLFSQYQTRFDVLSGLLLTLGVRYDDGESAKEAFSQTSPRIALVQKLTDEWNVKLLVGQALRGPTNKEVTLNNQIRAGSTDPSLLGAVDAETITSTEIGATYDTSIVSLGLTLFKNETDDAITRGGPTGGFINRAGTTTSEGIEIEMRYAVNALLQLRGNYSWAEAEDDDGNEVNDVPTQKANMIAMFNTGPVENTLIAHWVKDYRVADPDVSHPDGFNTVDFNAVLAFSKNSTVELQMRNMFDKQHKLPKSGTPDVPLPGRSIHFSIKSRL